MGNVIIKGNDKLLKVVAGMIIRRLVAYIQDRDPKIKDQFLADSIPEGILKEYGFETSAGWFPEVPGSQFYKEIGTFISEVEAARDDCGDP